MFYKKKFKLVEKKSEEEIYSGKNSKCIRYCIIMGLIGFVLLIILANVKSKSYYENLKAQKFILEAQSSRTLRSFPTANEVSTRAADCSITGCSVSCTGDMSDLKEYLNQQKKCSSMSLAISNYFFPDDLLQRNWLEGTFNLSIIRISKGTLKSIDDGAFNQPTVKYVTELQLSDVKIQTLTAKTFTGLSSLKQLTLGNKVDIFEGDSFLKPMEETLEKIEIKIVSPNALDPAPWLRGNFKKLATIVFDGSNFGANIRNDTFEHLTELCILTMISCKISTLPNGVFNFMMKHMVVFIALDNNALKEISGNYLKKVSSLRRISLQNNLWYCSCKLNELIIEYQRYPDGFGDDVKCSAPSSFADQSLGSIEPFECEDPTTTISTSVTTSGTISTEYSPITFEGMTDISSETSKFLSTVYTTINTTPKEIITDSSTVLKDTTTTSIIVEPDTTLGWNVNVSDISSTTEDIELTYSTSRKFSSTETSESGDLTETTTVSSFFSTSDNDGISSTPSQTTPSPQNRTTTLSANTIFIECQRYNTKSYSFANAVVELAAPLTGFTITNISTTVVKLTIEQEIKDLALIWFYDQPHINGSGSNMHFIGEFTIGCQSDVENSLTIEGLSENRAYTFCLVQEGQEVISPFSCRSYYSGESEGLNKCEAWLKNEDKALTIGLFVSGIVITLSLGILSAFLVLRAYPILLKGSKRVIIVNRSTGDVLIMPDSNKKQNPNESSARNSYETNTTIPQRRFSAESIKSSLSYMLANNYEDIEYRWKMNVVNDMIYANRIPKSPPPPLPKRVSETACLEKECYQKIDISVIHTKVNDYGYIP